MDKLLAGNGPMLLILVAMAAAFFWMSRNAKKKNAARARELEQALTPGTWVMTNSGYYAIVVDVDGDVVVLESHNGTESFWDKRAISGPKEPPFANNDQEEQSSSEESAAGANDGEEGTASENCDNQCAKKDAQDKPENSSSEDNDGQDQVKEDPAQ